MAASRSSRSSEPPPWLREVYERRRRRTIRLVQLSIAALERAGNPCSLAALARISKTVDPQEPNGVSEGAILHNEEAYALYEQHARPNRRNRPRANAGVRQYDLTRINADRDRGRARQRYMRGSKTELVERLMAAEQAHAEMEARWLKTADELLAWILLADRLLAGQLPPRARTH